MRKIIFSDIDGTLYGKNGISRRVIDAIQAARAQGHLFFVCTGRSRGFVQRELKEAPFVDGFVMACGMHCEMGERTLYRQRIPVDVLEQVAKYFCDQKRECHFDGEDYMIGLHSEREIFKKFEHFDDVCAELRVEPVSKITIPGPLLPGDREFLEKWFTVYDMHGWLDVVPTGVSKATGMAHVLEALGIPRENSIGVGDGSNDLPMIEFAGLGVAMGNAPEDVKLRADAVTESCANDGVAVMIEKYVLE